MNRQNVGVNDRCWPQTGQWLVSMSITVSIHLIHDCTSRTGQTVLENWKPYCDIRSSTGCQMSECIFFTYVSSLFGWFTFCWCWIYLPGGSSNNVEQPRTVFHRAYEALSMTWSDTHLKTILYDECTDGMCHSCQYRQNSWRNKGNDCCNLQFACAQHDAAGRLIWTGDERAIVSCYCFLL